MMPRPMKPIVSAIFFQSSAVFSRLLLRPCFRKQTYTRIHEIMELGNTLFPRSRAIECSPRHARKEEFGRGHPAPRKGAAAPLTPASGEHSIALAPPTPAPPNPPPPPLPPRPSPPRPPPPRLPPPRRPPPQRPPPQRPPPQRLPPQRPPLDAC